MKTESFVQPTEQKPLQNQGEREHVNLLIHEKSPYLLQHAHNPVDWHPWGSETFDKAIKENKPVFLSIGYSTCHWCHVMEHESFEDRKVASLMNDAFISVKVDREERPDLDSIYMDVCQIFTGRGGWPLNIVMSPDKKPFFAATYIPRETRFGIIGMIELVPMLKDAWINRHEKLMESADQSLDILRHQTGEQTGKNPDAHLFDLAYKELENSFDSVNGGFGNAPKFPSAHTLLFLLRYHKRTGDDKALDMAEKTLQSMRQGGIYDHIGFGFHRYSTDARWIQPHFEKMLYDQAMLAMAYTEAYQATGKDEYKKTAKDIFTYVLRDMTSPQGGFYSAEDADSEGSEGKFYLWTLKEIEDVFGTADSDFIRKIFTMEESGNFFEQTTGEKTGMNIPYPGKTLAEMASTLQMTEHEFLQRSGQLGQKLFTVRQRRVRPHKDDKILTGWNGLMIASLAKASQVFDDTIYADTAAKAMSFILGNMRNNEGRLLHRYRDGEAAIPAFLDDYASLIWGLIELYEATFEASYLQTAIDLNDDMIKHFMDKNFSGFYFTSDDAEHLPIRRKELHDSALPSGNSIAMLNLFRLSRMTGNTKFEHMAVTMAQMFTDNVIQYPSAYTHFLCALDFAIGPSYEVVIAGNKDGADTSAMMKTLRSNFIPNKIVILHDSKRTDGITDIAPFTLNQTSIEGKATAYVCTDNHCESPTTDPGTMLGFMSAAGKNQPVR